MQTLPAVSSDHFEPVKAVSSYSLDELAQHIRTYHSDAVRHVRASVESARYAGAMLHHVKENVLPHGAFMAWRQEHCEFSHSTALLYIRVYKYWHQLADSQSVENLTLQQAAGLIGPHAEGADMDEQVEALSDLGLLTPADVAGLSKLAIVHLSAALREAYVLRCEDVDEVALSERASLLKGEVPPYMMQRSVLGGYARAAAKRMREHAMPPAALRKHFDPLGGARKKGAVSGGAAQCRLIYVAPLDRYSELTRRFIGESRALLTEPHGLLDEHVSLDEQGRRTLSALITKARSALDALEATAAARTPKQTAK